MSLQSESYDDKANIAAMGKAITATENGASGSFLQSAPAATLQRPTISMDMRSADRDMLSAFLSHGEGYAPQSGSIVGIRKQMKETMETDLVDITATEEASVKDFEALMAAKEKEIDANASTSGLMQDLWRLFFQKQKVGGNDDMLVLYFACCFV